MTMVPRDPITQKQIDEAKGKSVEKGRQAEIDGEPDSQSVKEAEVTPAGRPSMPGKLPGTPR